MYTIQSLYTTIYTLDFMGISISEASKRWRVTRPTIYKKIKQGKLSRFPDKTVDIAEMVQVFGDEPNVNKSVNGVNESVKDTVPVYGYIQSPHEAVLEERIRNLEENLRLSQEREQQALFREQQYMRREQTLQNQVQKLMDLNLIEAKKKEENPIKKGFFSRWFD